MYKAKNINLYLIIFIIFLLIQALGKFYRYPIAEQLGISLNYFNYGNFYPDEILNIPFPHSVYFPGLAILINLLRLIIPDYYLMEILYFLAILVILGFFYLSLKISNEIFSNNLRYENFWLIIIILCLWPAKFWLFYAITFKTDILAFTLIIFSIYLSKPYLKKFSFSKETTKIILSIIILSFSILIKQQAIFIIFPLLIYFFLFKNLNSKIYIITLLIIISFVLLSLKLNKSLWFFNFEIFKFHEFMEFNYFINENLKDFLRVMSFFLFVSLCYFLKFFKTNFKKKTIDLKLNYQKNVWLILLFFLSLTGFISGFKYGGNFGNFELSLILFSIFFFYYLNDLNVKILKLIVILLLILNIPKTLHSGKTYLLSKKFQNVILNKVIIKDNDSNILTDNSSLYGSFLLSEGNNIFSMDTIKRLNEYNNKKNSSKIKLYLNKKDLEKFDIIILSNEFKNNLDTKNFIMVDNSFGKFIMFKKTKN